MKSKQNAKQKRKAEEQKRRDLWTPKKELPAEEPKPASAPRPRVMRMEDYPQQSPEEETLEFLQGLEKYGNPARKEDLPRQTRKKSTSGIQTLNLEEGMPLVEEALARLNMGLQEMRVGRIKVVKLIHGYGSTGRGGKICLAVRDELAAMKRRKLIKEYIPGEDFGPMDPAVRKLAERNSAITRDPDYGRMNHGITIVVIQE